MTMIRCQRRQLQRRLRVRGGLTIIEVLMAIGVAIIGLFGVWALIPIAGQKAQRALLEDDKAMLGRSAFREFEVRGARQSDTWLMSARRLDPNLPANRLVRVPEVYNNTVYMAGRSFCIDPHLFAEKIAVGQSDSVGTFPAPANWLPSPPNPPTPTMVRVTLLRAPSSRLPLPLPNRNAGTLLATFDSNPNNYFEMNLSQAELVFQGADDLTVNRNDDETLPAVQQYLREDPTQPLSSTNPATRRANDGNISWMATLVPSRSNEADGYHLSVAVFNRREVASPLTEQETVYRVLDPSAATASPPRPSNLPGKGFPSAGFGGGEVVLDTGAVDFQRNNWVMLASSVTRRFAWYRVVNVEADSSEDVTYVTLVGQDWFTGGPDPQEDNVATQLFFVKGVVAIYEKTIRMETSSLWKLE